MSPDAHLRTDRMPRVRGPPSARRRGRWSARPRGRAPSPTSPVPHTLYSTIPEAELRTTDRVTRPPTIKHITLPRPTSFFYYFLFFEKGSVESTHKVPTSHYRTKHCLLGGQSAHSHTETTGALAASFMTILRLLARQTRLPGATDNTRYGEGRASPRSFLTHHVANMQASCNISTAIQAAETPKPSSTPPERACYGSRMGSCKVCVF